MGLFDNIFDGVAGPVIGTIGGLIGADMQRESNRDARVQQEGQFGQSMELARHQQQYQEGIDARNFAAYEEERDYNRRMREHGIPVRVKDAKNAGIHPLAALGMPTTGGSPISIPSSGGGSGLGPSPSGISPGGDPGGTIAALGQNIGRAIDAKMSEQENADNKRKRLWEVWDAGKNGQILPNLEVMESTESSNVLKGIVGTHATSAVDKNLKAEINNFAMKKWGHTRWEITATGKIQALSKSEYQRKSKNEAYKKLAPLRQKAQTKKKYDYWKRQSAKP